MDLSRNTRKENLLGHLLLKNVQQKVSALVSVTFSEQTNHSLDGVGQ